MRGSELEMRRLGSPNPGAGLAPPSPGKVQPPKAPSRGSTATKVWGLGREPVAGVEWFQMEP